MVRNILVLDAPDEPLAELTSALADAVDQKARVEVVREAAAVEQRLAGRPAGGRVRRALSRRRRADDGGGRDAAHPGDRRRRAADRRRPRSGDVHAAAEAVDAGATDFLVRGDRLRERLATLIGKVRRTLALVDRNRDLREQNLRLRQRDRERARLVGESPQIREVRRLHPARGGHPAARC